MGSNQHMFSYICSILLTCSVHSCFAKQQPSQKGAVVSSDVVVSHGTKSMVRGDNWTKKKQVDDDAVIRVAGG